jgi:hypothetical protein
MVPVSEPNYSISECILYSGQYSLLAIEIISNHSCNQCCGAGAARSCIIMVEQELYRDVDPALMAPAPNLITNTDGSLKMSKTLTVFTFPILHL